MLYQIHITGEYAGDNGQGGEETAYLSECFVVECAEKPTREQVEQLLNANPQRFEEYLIAKHQAESCDYFVDEPDISIQPLDIIKL